MSELQVPFAPYAPDSVAAGIRAFAELRKNLRALPGVKWRDAPDGKSVVVAPVTKWIHVLPPPGHWPSPAPEHVPPELFADVDWTTDRVVFGLIPEAYSQSVADFASKMRGCEFLISRHFLSVDTFEPFSLPPAPADVEFGPLTEDDAALVDEYWVGRGPGSLDLIKHNIRHYPNLGARRQGQLISWVLSYECGLLGPSGTRREIRNQGLSRLVVGKIVQQFREQGKLIFGSIDLANAPSQHVMKNLAGRATVSVTWIVNAALPPVSKL